MESSTVRGVDDYLTICTEQPGIWTDNVRRTLTRRCFVGWACVCIEFDFKRWVWTSVYIRWLPFVVFHDGVVFERSKEKVWG